MNCIESLKNNSIYIAEQNFVVYFRIIWNIQVFKKLLEKEFIIHRLSKNICYHKVLDIFLSIENSNPRKIKIETEIYGKKVCSNGSNCPCEENHDEDFQDNFCACTSFQQKQCPFDQKFEYENSSFFNQISDEDSKRICECSKDSINITTECFIKTTDDKEYRLILNKPDQSFDVNYCRSVISENLATSDDDSFSIMIDYKIDFESKRRIIINQFEQFFGNTNFQDFVITCSDGNKLYTNAMVLAMSSPYFKAIMNIPSNNNQIILKNINSKTMQEVLRFVYYSKVNDLHEIVEALLYAAGKFKINNLTNLCTEYLSKNLRKRNVFDTLALSKMYNLKFLTYQCYGLIMKYYKNMNDEFDDISDEIKSKIYDEIILKINYIVP
ncbi:hypothetical protein PVAND_000454 [Polypedilum vanderplanki]|uniref:BTB domain-containing protein n=1 Tax=Polypedilum vanderplanki TaxID=319348 RepID=A0A9J6BK55_POLVA|nr:hypothetical protein PVAND_000454 [Polypedilum vanderplanki]